MNRGPKTLMKRRPQNLTPENEEEAGNPQDRKRRGPKNKTEK
jgi:hypothetical protein